MAAETNALWVLSRLKLQNVQVITLLWWRERKAWFWRSFMQCKREWNDAIRHFQNVCLFIFWVLGPVLSVQWPLLPTLLKVKAAVLWPVQEPGSYWDRSTTSVRGSNPPSGDSLWLDARLLGHYSLRKLYVEVFLLIVYASQVWWWLGVRSDLHESGQYIADKAYLHGCITNLYFHGTLGGRLPPFWEHQSWQPPPTLTAIIKYLPDFPIAYVKLEY